MTYKQAYDKIIDAYFKDEIQPYNAGLCFCGTLAGCDSEWQGLYGEETIMGYLGHEYLKMERALLENIKTGTVGGSVYGDNIYIAGYSEIINDVRKIVQTHTNYESSLFKGMSAALDVLKQIHIERGEIIDEPIETFKKRELSQV